MPEKTVQKEPGKKPASSKKPKPQQEVVVQIPLSELHPFPDHPFQVREDASMQETAESVKEYGVLVPALARPREDGGYELIAGHRRKHACELAGLATMPVIVRDIDRDTATIIMVDSNLQRENILPSERAKAYKMKMEAIKRQGARTDLTSPKISAKFRSDDEVGQDAGVSGDTIRNYIALTQLVPELQQMVDEKKIALSPAYQIAALTPKEQGLLLETIDSEQATPSLSQAQRMKKLSQSGELNEDTIRLPNNAFKANAGTDVVSDILFLQKRDRPIEIEPDWVHLSQNGDGFAINRYFVDHPEMILGRQTSESTQYGKQDFTVVPIEGLELADQLHDAVKNIRGAYQEAELPELGEGEQIDTSIPADPNVKNYSYTVVDGEVYYRENSRMVKPELNATAAERIKGMVALRDCVNELIALQMDEYSAESRIQEAQAELNRLYDAFSAKHGLINERANRLAFSDDFSYYLLCSLEVLDDDGKLERKADMFHKRTIKQQRSVDSVDTASEALAVCIGEKACVDLSFMATLMGGSEKIPQIVEDLKGVIYKEPNSGPFDLEDGGEHWAKGWQTADEYLSGNVRQKLRTAQRVAARDPFFAGNVDALIAAQPKDLEASEIEVRLGATWFDKKYIEQFMYETFETPRYLRGQIEISYVPYTAEWQVSRKSMVRYNDVAAFTTYGTDRASAYRLLEDALNLRDIRIYDTIEDADGRERRVLNAKETTLAAQKQQLIRDAFKDWIWKDPERRETLVRQYNEEMNSTRPREYDGSHIVFSGMNPEITLREHQKNAIAHVLYGGNTLLAHEVGAGKTFEW